MNDDGDDEDGTEGVLEFINDRAGAAQPWCLVVALVNPTTCSSTQAHRPWIPRSTYRPDTKTRPGSRATSGFRRPSTRTCRTKPECQAQFATLFGASGRSRPSRLLKYLNFYGNLLKTRRRLPGQRPRRARVDRPAQQHSGDPHRRPRREGTCAPDAAEEPRRLRGDHSPPPRLLQPRALRPSAQVEPAGVARRHAPDPCLRWWTRPVRLATRSGQGSTTSTMCSASTRRRPRSGWSSPSTTGSPASRRDRTSRPPTTS